MDRIYLILNFAVELLFLVTGFLMNMNPAMAMETHSSPNVEESISRIHLSEPSILIKAVQADELQFLIYLKQNPNHISLLDFYTNQIIDNELFENKVLSAADFIQKDPAEVINHLNDLQFLAPLTTTAMNFLNDFGKNICKDLYHPSKKNILKALPANSVYF